MWERGKPPRSRPRVPRPSSTRAAELKFNRMNSADPSDYGIGSPPHLTPVRNADDLSFHPRPHLDPLRLWKCWGSEGCRSPLSHCGVPRHSFTHAPNLRRVWAGTGPYGIRLHRIGGIPIQSPESPLTSKGWGIPGPYCLRTTMLAASFWTNSSHFRRDDLQ